MGKVDYVRAQGQTRQHECHWPDCPQQVPPAMWGCKKHWFMLPAHIRGAIWAAYSPGQEVTMDPSEAYIRAANEAQQWIRDYTAGELEKARAHDAKTRDLFSGDS